MRIIRGGGGAHYRRAVSSTPADWPTDWRRAPRRIISAATLPAGRQAGRADQRAIGRRGVIERGLMNPRGDNVAVATRRDKRIGVARRRRPLVKIASGLSRVLAAKTKRDWSTAPWRPAARTRSGCRGGARERRGVRERVTFGAAEAPMSRGARRPRTLPERTPRQTRRDTCCLRDCRRAC